MNQYEGKVNDIIADYPSHGNIVLKSVYECHAQWCQSAEKSTKKWWAENIKEDWIILDIGAHVGMYSVLFSQKAPKGTIHCMEPTPTIELLRENLASIGATNCETYQYAVGNKTGKSSDLVHMIWQRKKLEQEFDFITVDDFVKKHNITAVDAIKIDTDGYDPEVLYGAKETLKKFYTRVIVEFNPGALAMRNHTPQQAVDFMKSIGYGLEVILDGENYLFKKGI
jgi:FkbM family methyltransferase